MAALAGGTLRMMKACLEGLLRLDDGWYVVQTKAKFKGNLQFFVLYKVQFASLRR